MRDPVPTSAPHGSGQSQHSALAPCQGVAFLVSPDISQVVAATPSGWLFLGQPAASQPITLDSAMPAIAALRALTKQMPANDPCDLVLTFWTGQGAKRASCRVQRVSGTEDPPLVLIEPGVRVADSVSQSEVDARDQSRCLLAAPASLDRDQSTATTTRPQDRSDHDTLREIARRIRQGHLRAMPEPDTPPGAKPEQRNLERINTSGIDVASVSIVPVGHVIEPTASETSIAPPERAQPTADPMAAASVEQPALDTGDVKIIWAELAHELKTPLSAISAAAEIMKDGRFGPIGDERYASYVADIHDNARHGLALVDRLLNRGSALSGEISAPAANADNDPPMTFAPLDLNKLVESCLSSMRPLAGSSGLTLEINLAREQPTVVADEVSTRQIVLNLLTNAVKFTPRGGRVVVTTERAAKGQVHLIVRDTGPGMSAGDIASALRPLRSRKPGPRPGGGFGIGLPLVNALAAANGATLAIKSPEKGGGTEVDVAFARGRLIAI